MRARIHVVNDFDSQTRTLRPDAFTDLAQGRIGTWARPGTKRQSWLAADILTAFGVVDGHLGNGRAGEATLRDVTVWARVHDIRHLYVQNAFLLPATVLTELLETTRVVGWDIWLVGDTGYTNAVAATVEDFCRNHRTPPPQELDAAQFLKTFPPSRDAPRTTTAADTQADAWPTLLPADDFTTFRAACRDRLTAKQFATVDGTFVGHARTAEQFGATLPTEAIAREEAVAGWLHQRWREVPTTQQFIVIIRATQVGLFRAQLWLRVDLDRLVATADVMPHEALRSPVPWRRLAVYAAPVRGTVCALAAAGLTVREMRALLISHIAADGSSVDVRGRKVEVFEPAQVYIRAQLLQRSDAKPDEPFLATIRGTSESEPRLARILTDVRRELGVAVAAPLKERDTPSGSRWMTRWGLTLKELT